MPMPMTMHVHMPAAWSRPCAATRRRPRLTHTATPPHASPPQLPPPPPLPPPPLPPPPRPPRPRPRSRHRPVAGSAQGEAGGSSCGPKDWEEASGILGWGLQVAGQTPNGDHEALVRCGGWACRNGKHVAGPVGKVGKSNEISQSKHVRALEAHRTANAFPMGPPTGTGQHSVGKSAQYMWGHRAHLGH